MIISFVIWKISFAFARACGFNFGCGHQIPCQWMADRFNQNAGPKIIVTGIWDISLNLSLVLQYYSHQHFEVPHLLRDEVIRENDFGNGVEPGRDPLELRNPSQI